MDWDEWREVHADLAEFTDEQLEYFLGIAKALLLDENYIKDEDTLLQLYGLLVCHMATLANREYVGTVSGATQGSVSTSFQLPSSDDDIDSWYMQTPCGWAYLRFIKAFRLGGIYRACKNRHIV